MRLDIALRVLARFERAAAAAPRQHARTLTSPINKPRGISPEIVREHGATMLEGEDQVDPAKRDIRPADVFTPTPDNTGVLNFALNDKDFDSKSQKQVRKDKGYDVVKNLSQYLIRTEGGSEGGPEGKT